MNKELLNTLDTNTEVLVTFRTKTGKIRNMGCSRYMPMIPVSESGYVGIDDPKLHNKTSVAVWDYQNSAWRSFRYDSVISYSVIES